MTAPRPTVELELRHPNAITTRRNATQCSRFSNKQVGTRAGVSGGSKLGDVGALRQLGSRARVAALRAAMRDRADRASIARAPVSDREHHSLGRRSSRQEVLREKPVTFITSPETDGAEGSALNGARSDFEPNR
jgi:hypothetical protein